MEVEDVPPLLHEHLNIANAYGVNVLGGKAQERTDVIEARQNVEGCVDAASSGYARRVPHPLLSLGGVSYEVGDASSALEDVDFDVTDCELRPIPDLCLGMYICIVINNLKEDGEAIGLSIG